MHELPSSNPDQKKYAQTFSVEGLEEHEVVEKYIEPLLPDLPKNVKEILYYATTEILNNAIDHSEGTTVGVFLRINPSSIDINIVDNGVGIFNKIQKALELDDPHDAILELCKGKLTTDPAHHTGEGIFFTSRVCDSFNIKSGKIVFIHVRDQDWLLDDQQDYKGGTAVNLQISRNSEIVLKEVFDKFTSAEDEYFGFSRTVLPIAIAQYGPDGLLSRSKAKRVLNRISKFKEVVFNFEGVDSIGQAFADEIFRVFANAHPDVHIEWTNANENVERMIRRAQKNNVDKIEKNS